MKKRWVFFWIMTGLGAAAVSGGCWAAFRTARTAWVVFWTAALLVAAWAVFFFRFRSIEYAAENDCLIIRGGVLIRTERIVKKTDVLWITTVKIGSVVLFTVIHTAAARAVVFAELDRNVFAD